MSSVPFRLTNEALLDLDQIWIFTLQNWSKKQADRYYDVLLDEIRYIAKNPLVGKSIDHLRPGYRLTKVKSHIIFYRTLTDNKVEIVRILHQRMNVKDKLN